VYLESDQQLFITIFIFNSALGDNPRLNWHPALSLIISLKLISLEEHIFYRCKEKDLGHLLRYFVKRL
jgi:hypothetical protein